MEYVRIAPTPWVRTSQPSSSSMGEPQLPSWTELHAASATSSGVAVGQCRRSSDTASALRSPSYRDRAW